MCQAKRQPEAPRGGREVIQGAQCDPRGRDNGGNHQQHNIKVGKDWKRNIIFTMAGALDFPVTTGYDQLTTAPTKFKFNSNIAIPILPTVTFSIFLPGQRPTANGQTKLI